MVRGTNYCSCSGVLITSAEAEALKFPVSPSSSATCWTSADQAMARTVTSRMTQALHKDISVETAAHMEPTPHLTLDRDVLANPF
jgi:hypothetical protein